MGLCTSTSTEKQMGSTFSSMENDGQDSKNIKKAANSSTSASRAARYGGSSSTTTSADSSSMNNSSSNHTEPINDILVGVDSDEIFTCSDDKSVCCLNTGSSNGTSVSQVVQRWSEHKRSVTRMAYGPLTDQLWTCSRDLTIKRWQRGQDHSVCTIADGHDLNITALCLNPSESLLCSGSRDTVVCLWDVNTGAKIFRKKTSRNLVTCMQWRNENTVIQGSEDLKLRTWDCRDRALEAAATMTGYVYFPLCIDVIEEHYVCTGSKGFDGVGCELRIWDMRTNQCVTEMNGHRQSIVGCRFLGNKNSIVTVSKDQTMKVWDCDKKTITADILGHTGSQFTCVDSAASNDTNVQYVYGGAASGYSKYKYKHDDCSLEHMSTFTNVGLE